MDLFNYNEKIDSFVINLLKDILKYIKLNGFFGEHHLYITFNILFPGVYIPENLLEKYPESMTIVIQHQYYDLTVENDFFSVKLSFNGMLELLIIPFNSILFIKDPYSDFSFTFTKKEEVISNIKYNKEKRKKTKIRKITFNN